MLKRDQLHSYQKQLVQKAWTLWKLAIFIDMGLGKTVTGLTIASDFLDDFRVTKVLIVAPLRVANTVWHKEIENWAHLNHLKIAIATGNPKQRLSAIHSDADIVIINIENVSWLCNLPIKWPFGMLIIDESSKFKSYKAKRFKDLRKKLKYIKSVILLTGTPAPEGSMDLWSQIYMLDNGHRLGRTITNFRKRFFDVSSYMGFDQYEIKEGAYEKIKGLVKDCAVTLYAKDVLTRHEPILDPVYIELSPKAQKVLTELKKDLVTMLEDGTEIATPSAGGLVNKMLQVCNGAIYDEEKNYHELHDEKLKALRDMVDDNPNGNFLVAYNFKSDLIRLQKAFPEAVVLSKEGIEVDQWNDGKIRILLAHPKSAGHGLNLQFGGSICVWFGLTWSLEEWLQFNKRLDRQGQKDIVRIIPILARGGIDEAILEAIKIKDGDQTDFMDHLKMKMCKL